MFSILRIFAIDNSPTCFILNVDSLRLCNFEHLFEVGQSWRLTIEDSSIPNVYDLERCDLECFFQDFNFIDFQ